MQAALAQLKKESEETAMKPRKLTKEDIDKVRDIEGFPIGTDEDIIALSDAPYYTACPNPFIEEFIKEYGTPYDEATDDYHREPFAADVSEGKHDPFYMAHGYHTKVPYMAIMRYILHYTNPGDIVLDAFCGTGMAAVAALQCGTNDAHVQYNVGKTVKNAKWGKRYAIASDLSSIASFIAHNYTAKVDLSEFNRIISSILQELRCEYGWLYETIVDGVKYPVNYYVWSDVYICKNCSCEFLYWDAAIDPSTETTKAEVCCPCCGAKLSNKDMEKAYNHEYDQYIGGITRNVKQQLVMIKYTAGKTQYKKVPDASDTALSEKIKQLKNDSWVPINEILAGDKTGEPLKIGVNHAYQYYTHRNLFLLSKAYEKFDNIDEQRYRNLAKFLFSSVYSRSHRMNRYMPNYNRHVGPLAGTLYFPFFSTEINVFQLLQDKLNAILKLYDLIGGAIISTQSATNLTNVPEKCVDYIFTDPPFGDNIMYSELNYVNESWNKVITNNRPEAIMNRTQCKSLLEYQKLMNDAFCEYYRVLKPGRWITVEFHNSKNSVWNAIREAINQAGFIVADVRTLDKKKGTTNQLSYGYAVKQDLIISAYKPKESFHRDFIAKAGSEETAWVFVHQHLENIPVVNVKNDKIESVAERQAYLLFDRMVAYHIMQGISVPLDATDFYRGLDERFLKRDNMYFLPDQVNEYDMARIKTDVENVQFSLFVTNEKSAISWLYQQLDEQFCGPQTYAEIQPKFMQEVKSIDRYEAMPELAVILEENFLQDENGRWYIPDVTKEGDVAKLREKKLWKEFEGYLNSKGKLKSFRSEAIRVGFSHLWKDKNYQAIVDIAERLPSTTIQEDPNLLMYYDISLGRV